MLGGKRAAPGQRPTTIRRLMRNLTYGCRGNQHELDSHGPGEGFSSERLGGWGWGWLGR